jgi:hypothetical protein
MQCTITDFIHNIFDFDNLPDDERVCLTLKHDDGTWSNYPASPKRLARYVDGSGAWYFCISTCAPPTETGYLQRGRDFTRYCYCLVLDDIGTKATPPAVEPSWKLESSESNFQWGYLIEPVDVSTPDGEAYVEGCIDAIARAGHSDAGARGTYRVVRVPGSLHRTGFVARVTDWHPERVWLLGDLMSELGLEPVKLRERRVSGGGQAVDIADVVDPVLDWLSENGHTTGKVGRKFVDVICPWAHEHTSGDATAGYTPAGYGPREFDHAFSCLHEHCSGRGKQQFLDWVASRGGPDPRVAHEREPEEETGEAPALRRGNLPDCQWGAKGPAAKQLSTDSNLGWVIEQLGVSCRFNMMTGLPEVWRDGWGARRNDRNDRTVVIRIRSELLRLGIANDRHLDDVLDQACLRSPYHPMGDWLDGLPVWDGVDRVADLAATVVTDNPLWPVYLRRWLVQVVAAVRGWDQPEQRPYVLVFSGAQGLGKSTWFSRLVPARYFTGEQELHLNGPGAKDQQIEALRRPMVELAELDSTFKKSEVGALKSFLSRPVDAIRLPYGRAAVERARCTVFCGTVNNVAFLTDSTGSRRFWPVHVESIDWGYGLDLGQLWAQVDALYRSGYGYHLSRDEAIQSAEESEVFQSESDVAEAFREYFTPALMATPRGEWVRASMADVADAIGLPPSRMNHPVVRQELGHLLDVRFGKVKKSGAVRFRIVPIQYGSRVPDQLKRHLQLLGPEI